MRVTFVIHALDPGGAQRVLVTMANYWAKKGWAVTILTFEGQEAPFYELHPAIRHHPLGIARLSGNPAQALYNNFVRLRVLRRAIEETTPQAVISFNDSTNVLTRLALFGARLPVIVSERSDPHEFPIGPVWSIMRRLVYSMATGIIVQSERAKHYFPGRLQHKIRVIPNPVIRPPQQVLEASGRPTGNTARVVIGMGRLSEEKGFDLLLRAFSVVAPRNPDWSLEIWGEGTIRSKLEAMVEQLGLQDRARLPGVTREPFREMARADLFVLSSRFEGFPNVLCEAMACGLPVVSFDCRSGPREIIRHGVDGLLVPPDDVDALAAAMDRLMSDHEARRRLSARAPEVIQRFGLENVMGMWEDMLAQACTPPLDRHQTAKRARASRDRPERAGTGGE